MVSGVTVLAALLLVLFAAPAAASSDGPTGVWLTGKKKAAIRIYDCGEGLCGRIVWLKKPLDKTGRLKRDKNNPNVASRNQPLCGVMILRGLELRKPGDWGGGTIYNPQERPDLCGIDQSRIQGHPDGAWLPRDSASGKNRGLDQNGRARR